MGHGDDPDLLHAAAQGKTTTLLHMLPYAGRWPSKPGAGKPGKLERNE
jgi:hypothetical protein